MITLAAFIGGTVLAYVLYRGIISILNKKEK